MSIIDLDPNIIAPATYQHRQDFSHVIDLARSIIQNGQQTPIQVYKLDEPTPATMPYFQHARMDENGRLQPTTTTTRTFTAEYQLIAGESRTRACIIAGLTVKAIIQDKPSDLDQSIGTLTENLNRKQPNPTEEAHAYKKVYDILLSQGVPEKDIIAEIAKHTGKYERTITDRLAILDLIEPFQIMVDKGSQSQGGINKHHALLIAQAIPKGYQHQLYKWYEQYATNATNTEIELQINHVKQLYYDSLQSSMFSFGSTDNGRLTQLVNIDQERPTINGRSKTPQTLDPLLLHATISKWEEARDRWALLGHKQTAVTMTDKIEVMKEMLTAVIICPSFITGKILEFLKNGNATTGRIQSFCHVTAEEMETAVCILESMGMISKEKSGRGWRYSLV